uniref:Uncharacterized protein n=1 Tax=Setaria italica TaxID=4555 RepID=K3Z006_SETIT
MAHDFIICYWREEEDDDMMMFLFPALYLMSFAREGGVKKKRYTLAEIGEVKVRRLLEGHVKNCQVTFRMEPHIFKEVATYLRRKILFVDTRITMEEKLGFSLYILSRNASYEDLAVIPTLSRHFLQSPDPNQVHSKIQNNPRYYPFFKNCLGTIDGTHIPSISYTKAHIQDKEGQLKRDYKMLKVARMQSGSKWNEQRNMVEGSPAMWENLVVTFPKIKKFQNNKASFPLYDALGELYDGHLVEGTYNFTSIESQCEEETLLQIDDVEDGAQAEEEALQEIHEACDENDEEKDARDEEEEARNCKIEAMMERFIEMRTKQAEDETKQLARENKVREKKSSDKEAAKGDKFSIKRCILVINTMEVTKQENVKAYAIFTKSKENEETFICASEEDQESALIWLRNEMVWQK